ncbi:mannose-P-dolichol utilization defect 1 protein-like protein 2-like [Cucumis melo var. makuwa]|uniref:Mannose-P-dolichol utilization defect 1 protein-like protein 2-like n=1 Tax=Cucumis melo var. makuwa TaxID=1194695 RepID=A0A5A7UCP7_CUCMM|nr:mannose-P-dolichol utilization defect 1 protein-like protein 2-like [Cucumis melo var. makuwa]
MKAEGLEATYTTGLKAYESPMAPCNLTDAKGEKCCSVKRQINVLGHVVKFHYIKGGRGRLPQQDIQWGGNLECQVAFIDLKQALIEGSSFWVIDVTKPPKVELLNVAQFDHSAQIDLLTKRSQIESKDSSHSILPPLTGGPYVGNNPQVHRVKKEWKQMADIIRVCLEEASRPMEERVDQKRCPIEFE